LNERTNDPRTILPQVRRQQFDNFSPIQQQEKPIINRRLPIRPEPQPPGQPNPFNLSNLPNQPNLPLLTKNTKMK